MKFNILFLVMISFLFTLTSPSTMATASKGGHMKRSQVENKNGYSTSHSFEGTDIQGKVQQGSLRKIVVENDKSLEDLLGVRKNFDDREKDETERNASW